MLLEVKDLRASYGPTRVLHGIDFAKEMDPLKYIGRSPE